MRIIPKKTNVSMEFLNGFTVGDIAVGFIGAIIEVAVFMSNLPGKYYIMIGLLIAVALLLLKLDDDRSYKFFLDVLRHYAYGRKYNKVLSEGKRKKRKDPDNIRKVIAYTGIEDNFIVYDKKYYGAVLELPSVEFRFFSEFRQNNAIEKALGGVLRSISPNYAANLVKIERPVIYDEFVASEHEKIEQLQNAYCHHMITEEELQRRVEVIYERIKELQRLSFEDKVVLPFFYLVLYDSDKGMLNNQVQVALDLLRSGELQASRLDDRQIAVFLKYTQVLDFDERDVMNVEPEELYEFSLPDSMEIFSRNIVVNNILTHNFRVLNYPMTVANAWGAFVFDTPGTKVVMKMKPLDRTKSIRAIDRSIDELRSQENSTGKASKLIDISSHIETLSELLVMLQNDNEILLDVNIYVTGYDIEGTQKSPYISQKPENSALPRITSMKKNIRRIYMDSSMKLSDMMFLQMDAWVAGQVSGYDPRGGKGRAIHSSSVAAVFPFVYTYTADKGGINLGRKNNIPVFIDFFRRDNERVNSNMVIIGKSGSGKSYATKTLLANLAAENSKIFVLDPENEYLELSANLGGKVINVGNATHGRLNPFQIITNLEDDEDGEDVVENNNISGVSFHTHLQFLEEFFKQILPDIEPDALEYLNNLIIRVYNMKGIEEHTDLSKLSPQDYPIFDDLYDAILEEFQNTKSDYLRSNLQILINYIAKFSSGGRNSVLWNGYSTISTEENFIVFNFQSLLANRNNLIANAQMLLVLKWLDNEIIKNRDYNKKYDASRKIVIVIDEAHVFIDNKYPLALDFMFQLAKRIRKYNGMQIVITQNIKDFVGSEELARKSTAIINACQYSLIFALAPNDMHDLCKLYEKAGQINEQEQEEIINAARGQAFVITSPTNRSSLQVVAKENVQHLFSDSKYTSPYFAEEEGAEQWASVMEELDSLKDDDGYGALEALLDSDDFEVPEPEEMAAEESRKRVKIVEVSEEEMEAERRKKWEAANPLPQPELLHPEPVTAPQPQGAAMDMEITRGLIAELRESLRAELMAELRETIGAASLAGAGASMFARGMSQEFVPEEDGYLEDTYREDDYSEDTYREDDYSEDTYREDDYSEGTYQEDGYSEGIYQEDDYSEDAYQQSGYADDDFAAENTQKYDDFGYAAKEERDISAITAEEEDADDLEQALFRMFDTIDSDADRTAALEKEAAVREDEEEEEYINWFEDADMESYMNSIMEQAEQTLKHNEELIAAEQEQEEAAEQAEQTEREKAALVEIVTLDELIRMREAV